MTTLLHGILPALITPFHDDGALNISAMESLLQRVYGVGSHGVYVCGQTGEGLLTPARVREQACEVALQNAPAGAQTVIHVGSRTTAEAISLGRHAARAGATAISSLPPAGSFSFDEIHGYYKDLAAAVDVPLLVYFFPELSPAIRTLEQILALCEISGVVGLKFTDFDLYRLGEIRREGHLLFNGRDEVLAAGLYMGATGGIGTFYNLIPRTFVGIHAAALRGDWVSARQLQDTVNRLIRITLAYPPLPAVKRMLTWSGIAAGECLKPRAGLSDEQWRQLRTELLEAGFSAEGFARGGDA
jgi:N-acetylneuraminate lyase